MNGDNVFLDTNAFIYFFEGRPKIAALIAHAPVIYYSPISEIELLSAPQLSQDQATLIKDFLALCQRVEVSDPVIDRTIAIRRRYHIKIPDAIIAASAVSRGLPLVSADTEFGKIEGIQLVADILT